MEGSSTAFVAGDIKVETFGSGATAATGILAGASGELGGGPGEPVDRSGEPVDGSGGVGRRELSSVVNWAVSRADRDASDLEPGGRGSGFENSCINPVGGFVACVSFASDACASLDIGQFI